MRPIIAIDPGSGSGAYAVLSPKGKVTVHKLPGPPAFLFAEIQKYTTVFLREPPLIFIEDVGRSRKGNARRSSDTFAIHRGHLEMLMVSLGLEHETFWVPPINWMKFIDPSMGWPHGNEGAVVKGRKQFFYDRAKAIYPEASFPKYAGDAVCLLHYGVNHAE